MTVDRTGVPHSVTSLLKGVDTGKLGLPEFQRDFIWRPENVCDLLRTVARDWPCGTFLLQHGPLEFQCKALESAPPLSPKPDLLILDGQQRLTALYQAYGQHGDEVYYLDLAALQETGQLENEHFQFLKSNKFRARYPDLRREADQRVVRVATLVNDDEFFRWLRFIPDDGQEAYIRLRTEHLSGFKHYSIPCVVLPRDLELAATAKIFETINRRGVRLDTFDLMVAKLYPYEFFLRDAWDTAISEESALERYEIEGLDILKLIALQHTLEPRQPGPTKVKGIRESDVIELPADAVKYKWTGAVKAMTQALDFMREHCGVVASGLVPAKAMTLPLADALASRESVDATTAQQLRRWFWSSTFRQTYGQGANTQAVADARALRAWMTDHAAIPDALRHFEPVDEETLLDLRRRNEMLLRGLMCGLIVQDARDWVVDRRLRDIEGDIQIHHVFPRQYLDNLKLKDANCVANFSPLCAATNKSLRNDPPTSVLNRADVSDSRVMSHRIPLGTLHNNQWQQFLAERSKLLQQLIAELVAAN